MSQNTMSVLVPLSLFMLLVITFLNEAESRSVPTGVDLRQDNSEQLDQEQIMPEQFRERRAIYRFPEYSDYGRNREKKLPRPGKNGYPHPSYGVLTYALG